MPKALETIAPREAPGTFEGLVCQLRARIERAAELLTGNRGEAEELTQETFVQAWLGWSRYAGRSEVFTWLYGILVNLCRVRWRERLQGLGSFDPPVPESPCPVERMEEEELVHRAIGTLSVDLRETLVLFYLQDLSLAEVAEALQIPLGTVKSRLAAARMGVRDALVEMGWKAE